MEMVAVKIPKESIKADLIGADARTIRAFRELSGVDLIIDDSPDQVYLKSQDKGKIQTARRALERMILERQFKREKIAEFLKGAD